MAQVIVQELDKLKKSEVEPNMRQIREVLALRECDALMPFMILLKYAFFLHPEPAPLQQPTGRGVLPGRFGGNGFGLLHWHVV